MRLASAGLLVFLALPCGCGGDEVRLIPDGDSDTDTDTDSDSDSDPDCDPSVENTPPRAPAILEPEADRIVEPDDLVVATSPFSDADGHAHEASEFEIWTAPRGERLQRIWRALVEGAASRTRVTLADGEYEGLAEGVGLPEWAKLVVRARFLDSGGGCTPWSAWSEDRPFRTDDGSSYFFDDEAMRDFELEISPESWDALNAEWHPGGCVQFIRHYQPATLIFEGEVYENVGVRLKGGCGSARPLEGKASFKINLEWDDPDVPGCPPERRIHGVTRFTLNAGIQDRTQEHEALGYRLYREMGVPAPRAGHARVWVNGAYYGVYIHVETIDRRFLSRWFDDNDGMLYEGAYWCDLVPENVPWSVDEHSCFTMEFRSDPCDGDPDPDADPMDWELLRDLTQQIREIPPGRFYEQIWGLFDFDTFLSMWAVDGAIAHWDAYSFHIINNYRVYHDPSTDVWTMIPWGIDQTFRGELDPWSTGALLVRRCLAESACEDAYAERLDAAIAEFERLALDGQAQRIFDVIAPSIRDDPRKEYNNAEFTWAHQELMDWIPRRPGTLRTVMSWHGY